MDWTSIGNQLIDILLPILATFLTGLFTYLGTKIKSAYEKKVNTETAKTVVQDVVKFVEQVYTDLHGKEKLQKAIEQTSTILQSKGITLTETEITMLIEAAVFGLNEGISSDDVKKTIEDAKEKDNEVIENQIEISELIGDETESSDENIG